jgi:PAS domain-containing protein
VHYRHSSLSGWLVSVGVDEAALEAPLHRSLWLLAGLGGFLILITAAASLPIVWRMVAAQRAAALAAQSLAEGEARHRMLADALPQMVWIMSCADGAASYMNEQFYRYYGPIGSTR